VELYPAVLARGNRAPVDNFNGKAHVSEERLDRLV